MLNELSSVAQTVNGFIHTKCVQCNILTNYMSVTSPSGKLQYSLFHEITSTAKPALIHRSRWVVRIFHQNIAVNWYKKSNLHQGLDRPTYFKQSFMIINGDKNINHILSPRLVIFISGVWQQHPGKHNRELSVSLNNSSHQGHWLIRILLYVVRAI